MLFNPTAKPTNKGFKNRKTKSFLQKHMLTVRNAAEIMGFMPGANDVVIIQTLNAFSAFDYVVYMQQRFGSIDELIISSYNMSGRVIETFAGMVVDGTIKKADIIINAKYKEAQADKAKFEEIITLSRKNPNIQLHFKQNHTKNILIRIGFKHFVWFGSGNSASNAEMEDYIWMMDTDIFNFKKNFLLNDN